MSLMNTLTKVAIGIAIAKGIQHVSRSGLPGATGTAGRGTPTGASYSPTDNGLGGIMDEITGGTAGRTSKPARGGLDDLLGGGTQTGQTGQSGGLGGGLGDLLGQLTGGKTAGSGGALDDLLGQLGGGTTAKSPRSSAPKGGLEDLLGAGGGGGGLGDLLGAVLGGAAGTAMSGRPQAQPEPAPARNEELTAALLLRAMIQAAKSDGKLEAAEKKQLMEAVGDASRAEIDFINAELAAPVDVAGLARQVPDGMEQQVYMMSLMAIKLDNRNEAQYLHTLAEALELTPQAVNAIHDHVQAPRLYS